MSESQFPAGSASSAEARVVVGSYATYADAERVVDYLSDSKFPVEHAVIVGRGLSSVEHVTGRVTTWAAAGQSALSGAILGALLGWIFGLLDWVDPLISGVLLAVYGAVFGAIVGALIGLVSRSMTGGRRDFASVTAMQADHYEVLVDASLARQAEQLIAVGPADHRRRE